METINNILQIIFFSLGSLALADYLKDKKLKIFQEIINEDQNLMKVFQDVYDSINFAIKQNHPKLVYDVEHMSIEEFMMLYKGIEKNYPFLKMMIRTNLEKKSDKNPNGTEYLEFDLQSYQGPRNIPLTVRLEQYIPVINRRLEYSQKHSPKKTRSMRRTNFPSLDNNESQSNIIYLKGLRNKKTQSSKIRLKETNNQSNVINLQEFRDRKKKFI